MDPGRYGPQQGWEHNSALEGYGVVHDSSFRAGGSYDGRRFLDEWFSRDNVYPRGSFHRDMFERDNYPPPHSTVNMWPQTRRRSYEEEYSIEKDYRRHEKLVSSHQGREDSHEGNHDYGRQSYDSDYDRGSRREGNWRRRESRDHEHGKKGLSWERDSPTIKYNSIATMSHHSARCVI